MSRAGKRAAGTPGGCSRCWRCCTRPAAALRRSPSRRHSRSRAAGAAAARMRRLPAHRLPPHRPALPRQRPPALAGSAGAAPPRRPRVQRREPQRAATPPPIRGSAAARADFERAVNFMRAGNLAEAELGFKQVALQYPQFAAPLVNLAILQRKAGQLEAAEQTLEERRRARERQRRRLDASSASRSACAGSSRTRRLPTSRRSAPMRITRRPGGTSAWSAISISMTRSARSRPSSSTSSSRARTSPSAAGLRSCGSGSGLPPVKSPTRSAAGRPGERARSSAGATCAGAAFAGASRRVQAPASAT